MELDLSMMIASDTTLLRRNEEGNPTPDSYEAEHDYLISDARADMVRAQMAYCDKQVKEALNGTYKDSSGYVKAVVHQRNYDRWLGEKKRLERILDRVAELRVKNTFH